MNETLPTSVHKSSFNNASWWVMLLIVCTLAGTGYVWTEYTLQQHSNVLRQEITQQIPANPTRELRALRTELQVLKLQIEAIPATPITNDAPDLDKVHDNISELKNTVNALEQRLVALETMPTTFQAPSPSAAHSNTSDTILNEFIRAVRTGEPFTEKLASLEASYPDIQISNPLQNRAATGIGTRKHWQNALLRALEEASALPRKTPNLPSFLARHVQVEPANEASLKTLRGHAERGELMAAKNAIDTLRPAAPQPLIQWRRDYQQYLQALRDLRALTPTLHTAP